jgi:hypothetical protein
VRGKPTCRRGSDSCRRRTRVLARNDLCRLRRRRDRQRQPARRRSGCRRRRSGEGLYNKRFEQSPDSYVCIHGNPGFCVYVWPLRARLSLGTAQLKRSVMLHESGVVSERLPMKIARDGDCHQA